MENVNSNKVAVIYCRVSTEEQAKEGLSVESQEIQCRRKADEEGYSVLEVIKDEGRSGKDIKRSGIRRILALIAEGEKIDAIYLVHKDRLSRNMADHIFLTDLFRKNKIILRSLNEPMMDDSAVGITMDMMMASFNQYHRLNTSEKVKSTMHEKVKAGYFIGPAPVGYKNVSYPNASERFARKVIEIDETKAPFVKEAFKLYGTGNYSVVDVIDLMYEKGFRTKYGTMFSYSNMYDILKNRFYLGEIHWSDIYIKEGKHPPLIDNDLFDRVQKIIDGHNNHACRKRKFEWLLHGFVRCYKHGCRYTAEWHKNSIAYYHCTKGGCGKFSKQEVLEEMVADKLKLLEFSPDFINLVLEKVKNTFYERRQSYENKRQGFVNQKTALEARMRVAEDKLLSKTISDDDFTRIRNELKSELASIDDRLIRLNKEKDIDVDMSRQVIGLTNNIYETYKKASPTLKRLLLGFFWERFDVQDGIIIKSVSSILFEELIKLEKAYRKNENTKIPSDSNEIIKSGQWCGTGESNSRQKIGNLLFYH